MSIKMTINGKPATPNDLKKTLEQDIFNLTIEDIKENISKAITPTEAAKITVDIEGNNIKNLKVNINGPDEIVAKITKALS